MKISIAYAVPGRQVLQAVDVPEGTTIRGAIEASGILEQLPGFSFEQQKVGIFGKVKPLDTVLAAGDRVELYHPVTIDPKAIPKKKPAAKDAAGE
ncbi:MAG: RnfH family protein [Proteobacteria bacterium]|nr:RnfH family protein [Pseudomonadota bacterium]